MKAKVNGIEINYEITRQGRRALAGAQPLARLQRAHVGPAGRRVQGQLPHPATTTCAATARTEAPKRRRTRWTCWRRTCARPARRAEDQAHALLRPVHRRHDRPDHRAARTRPFERMVLADTTHTQPPEARKQWEDRIRIAESKGMAALVDSTMERWFTPPFRDQPDGEEDRRADPGDAGGRLRRLRPRHHAG